MTLSHHAIMPDTPENREKLFQSFPDYAVVPIERRPPSCFLIVRHGVVGWVDGPDADGAEFIIAQYHPRTLVTLINAPRGDVRSIPRWP